MFNFANMFPSSAEITNIYLIIIFNCNNLGKNNVFDYNRFAFSILPAAHLWFSMITSRNHVVYCYEWTFYCARVVK